ncbi:hypothetical protein L1049_024749 [Liquidambar formosana]|uniref:Uncharacterized protein n=1 Tax=Liquidambar formosana TaxID=63359 RepID=A0AAP0RWK5_LIQFO
MEPSYIFNNLSDSSLLYSSSPPTPQPTEWAPEENKIFECSLAEFDVNSRDLFQKIASRIPGKSIEQIATHYEILVEDVEKIESGQIPMPNYNNKATRNKSTNQQKKKPLFWTQEEHKNFLEGLDKYGKGDWRSISRNCVPSRTPTQVASHAQKYFLSLQKQSAAQNANPSTSKPNDFAVPMAMAPPSHYSRPSAAHQP